MAWGPTAGLASAVRRVRGETPRRTESGEAPAWQGATREHIGQYPTEEQRSPRGMHRRSNAAGLLPRAARTLPHVQRVYLGLSHMNEEVFKAVNDVFARGESAALVTIVRTQGSTPQRVGAKMLVFADGRTIGTIGGGCYENDAFWKARRALESRKPLVARYELADDIAEESGLICGGQMEVYIEPLEASPHLYLVGAGHVALHLGRLATPAGFQVHVIDDREKFSNAERFPDAVEVAVDDIPTWLENTDFPPTAYAVILTRGHRHDLDALRALAPRKLRYHGLIGSKAKVARLHDALREADVAIANPERLHAPVGLDIGAITPQEIAVSILAELIAVKYGKLAAPGVAAGAESAVKPLRWLPPTPPATQEPAAGEAPFAGGAVPAAIIEES